MYEPLLGIIRRFYDNAPRVLRLVLTPESIMRRMLRICTCLWSYFNPLVLRRWPSDLLISPQENVRPYFIYERATTKCISPVGFSPLPLSAPEGINLLEGEKIKDGK